jgi:hypothetical protein
MTFWIEEPWIVKAFLLGFIAVATIAVVKLFKLAGCLYLHSSDALLLERFVSGEVDPDVLATYALANRTPVQAAKEKSTGATSSMDRAAIDVLLYKLRAAGNIFAFRCERSQAAIESIKRAALLIFLLSFIMAASGAMPTYLYICESTNLPKYSCLVQAIDQLLRTFAVGLSLCAVLHILSGLVEGTLSARKTYWKYFLATLESELSGQ